MQKLVIQEILRKAGLAKSKALQELKDSAPIAVTNADAFLIRYCDSYGRLPQILELVNLMDRRDWYRVLGKYWSDFDNVGGYLSSLMAYLPSSGPVIDMMTATELEIYSQLDEELTIYRGCGEQTQDGLCWSMHRHVAAQFPFQNRYKTLGRPVLVTARAAKSAILAIKYDREEAEVITFRPAKISIKPLS